MIRTRTAITAFSLVSVLALGACSEGDPEPKFAPAPSSSAPTSPSTSAASGPIEPTMPAAAQGTDAAAAEAFVRFYWEMVNYAQQTGDVDGLRPLGRKCGACDNGVESVTDTYDRNGSISGGDARVDSFDTNFLVRDGDDWAVVESNLVLSKQLIDLPGTDDDKRFPGGRTDIRTILQPVDGAWVVRSMVTR